MRRTQPRTCDAHRRDRQVAWIRHNRCARATHVRGRGSGSHHSRGPGGTGGLEGVDVGDMAEGDADVVEALEQAVVVEVLELERLVEIDGRYRDAPIDDVDDDLD